MHLQTIICRPLAAVALLAIFASGIAWAEPARQLAATCTGCHGTDGHAQGSIPALAGRPAPELLGLLTEFRSGSRPSTIMGQIAKGYSEAQLRLITGYFAAQPKTAGQGS